MLSACSPVGRRAAATGRADESSCFGVPASSCSSKRCATRRLLKASAVVSAATLHDNGATWQCAAANVEESAAAADAALAMAPKSDLEALRCTTEWMRAGLRDTDELSKVLRYVRGEMRKQTKQEGAVEGKLRAELTDNLWKALSTWSDAFCYAPDPRPGMGTHSQEHSTFWEEQAAENRYKTMHQLVGKLVRSTKPTVVLQVIGNICNQHRLRMKAVQRMDEALKSEDPAAAWFKVAKETAAELNQSHEKVMQLLQQPWLRRTDDPAAHNNDATVAAGLMRPTDVSDVLPGVPTLGRALEEYVFAKREADEAIAEPPSGAVGNEGAAGDEQRDPTLEARNLAQTREKHVKAVLARMEEILEKANLLPSAFNSGNKADEIKALQDWEELKVDMQRMHWLKQQVLQRLNDITNENQVQVQG